MVCQTILTILDEGTNTPRCTNFSISNTPIVALAFRGQCIPQEASFIVSVKLLDAVPERTHMHLL